MTYELAAVGLALLILLYIFRGLLKFFFWIFVVILIGLTVVWYRLGR
jgi:hypothetical protein